MASSAEQTHHLPAMYGATAAPPPTPSTLQAVNHPSASASDATADLLSRLFHRLPPNLSLPSRSSKPPPTTPLPTLSLPALSNDNNLFSETAAAAVFQLTDHGIPSQLAAAAESESAAALFGLSPEQKESYNIQKEWPLGYEHDGGGESFCLDSLCSAEFTSTELDLAPLRQLAREMEGVGLRVVEALSGAVGFNNPFKADPARVCSLLWISKRTTRKEEESSGGFYPFVVGLHYQIRSGQKYSMFADSGRVSVSPEVDSLMVTVGDIAQVWSNGKLKKKVRGRPFPIPMESSSSSSISENKKTTLTISLLITLPLDNAVTVSPQKSIRATEKHQDNEERLIADEEELLLFTSFPFDDYAWRVYHQRLSLKDPLHRYRLSPT